MTKMMSKMTKIMMKMMLKMTKMTKMLMKLITKAINGFKTVSGPKTVFNQNKSFF